MRRVTTATRDEIQPHWHSGATLAAGIRADTGSRDVYVIEVLFSCECCHRLIRAFPKQGPALDFWQAVADTEPPYNRVTYAKRSPEYVAAVLERMREPIV